MDRKLAAKLIEENLNTIFAWSLSKVYDKSQAEDLAQDIICEVLKSVHRLECDDAFFGFMWRIAENTLYTRLRKKNYDTVEIDDNYCGAYWNEPESEVIKSEEIQLLRRELSLLSYYYREATVRYYIYGKSCAKIASELNISTEMVKYYLFKTRKIMKEGIGMTREYGEKSYNPQVFRVDFWGGNSYPYFELFKRRLPGNIVLSAYDKPVTVTELSIELGVSTVYLEDEIDILERHELLKKVGDKYQTNIIIFTEEYEKRVENRVKVIYEKAVEKIATRLDRLIEKTSNIGALKEWDEEYKKWIITNLIVYNALNKADKLGNERYGGYPQLSNGSYGFVYGYDNDYVNHHFNGIYGHMDNKKKDAYVTIINYRAIEDYQHIELHNWEKAVEALNDAVLSNEADEYNEEITRFISEGIISSDNGSLKAQFPVFTVDEYDRILDVLSELIDEVSITILDVCDEAIEVLKDTVPVALKDKCKKLAQIHYQMDVMALIVEEMLGRGVLAMPDRKINVGVFGVLSGNSHCKSK